MLSYFRHLSLFLILASGVLGSQIADADQLSFFPGKERDVRNIFGGDVKIEKAYYAEETAQLPESQPNKAAIGTTPSTIQDKIIAEYGDPAVPHEVKAIKDAPKPFQGMIEALKNGDKKLALDYAVQYQNYLKELESINRDATSIQGLAMYKTGELPEDSWVKGEIQNNPDLVQFLDKDQKPQNQQGNLALEAQELLKKAKRQDYDLFAGSEVEKREIAQAERMKARAELPGNVPYLPEGQLDVFFFFKSTEQQSIDQGKALQEIYSKLDDADQINLLAFPLDVDSPGSVKIFQKRTGAKYTTLASKDLAQKLNITNSPTVMIVDAATGKFYQINEVVSADYLDELFKIVRGR